MKVGSSERNTVAVPKIEKGVVTVQATRSVGPYQAGGFAEVTFSASATTTSFQGNIVSYEWQLGIPAEGINLPATGQTVKYTYPVNLQDAATWSAADDITSWTPTVVATDNWGVQGTGVTTLSKNDFPADPGRVRVKITQSERTITSGKMATLHFRAEATTTVPGATIQSCTWDFGDGVTAIGTDVTHTYDLSLDTSFGIIVTAVDSTSASSTDSIGITLGVDETPTTNSTTTSDNTRDHNYRDKDDYEGPDKGSSSSDKASDGTKGETTDSREYGGGSSTMA